MDNLCGLDEIMKEEQNVEMVSIEEHRKKKKAFHFWEVNGTSHKLKLHTGMISKLENKYHKNLLNIVSEDGIPPLSVMLTIVQAAISPWEHGIKYQEVEKLYDAWVEYDGGSQIKLMSSVIIPTMAVSGFFTPDQAESIMNSLENAEDLI